MSSVSNSTASATGIRYRQNGQPHLAKASAEVILSAGAIGSPQILQLSGIGPGPLLQSFGIKTVFVADDVGRNLQDHLQLRCIYKVENARTLNTAPASLWGKAKTGLEYALRRTGPMSMSPSQLGAFARSNRDEATPKLEYHIQPLSLEAFGQELHPFDALTASVCNLRPESRGHVALISPDPHSAPEIRSNYLATAKDRRIAAKAIRLTRHILAQPATAPYRPKEYRPGAEAETDEDSVAAAGDIGTTIFHPVGTVRMAVVDAAPVDDQLRVRGVNGLRVVDASIMPTIPSGNTDAPTIMIAEKAADMILGH